MNNQPLISLRYKETDEDESEDIILKIKAIGRSCKCSAHYLKITFKCFVSFISFVINFPFKVGIF